MAEFARMSDVARLAGVSTMTVSRVLNENQNVTRATREKVFAAVATLRYQPNELARSLREQRSRQIGIIVPYLYDPFFAICAHAISTVAKQNFYSVVLSTSNEDQKDEFDEASRMVRRNVEGLIVIPARLKKGVSLLLGHEFERLPIVALDRPVEDSRFDSVLVENEHGGQIGTEHLLSLGHQRVAYIGLSDQLYTMRMRHAGYTAAMERSGFRANSLLLSGEQTETLIQLRQLLGGTNPPTALFCSNNLVTRQVLHSLRAMGIHPPEGIALVGFDDFETADLLRPGVTVVRQPEELLGRTAANVLFSRLNNADSLAMPGKRTVLNVELVVRGSCGAKL